MSVLYVTEQGAVLRVRGQRLLVTKGRTTLVSERLSVLEQVVLCGSVQPTVGALRRLLRAGIDTVFLTQSGRYLGRLLPGFGSDATVRRTQYRKLEDEAFCVDVVRRIVSAKVANQRLLLLRYQRKRRSEAIARALVALRRVLAAVERATSVDELRGHEGQAAAAYFGVFGELILADDIVFPGRLRRPPPDPTNILLSFGYTLLTSAMLGNLYAASLDPYFGALHAPAWGRPSLALDLIETFRPAVVDVAVLRALNTRAIGTRDFLRLDAVVDTPAEDEWAREQAEADVLGLGDGEETVDEEEFATGERASAPPRALILREEGVKKWFMAWERRLGERAWYAPQQRHLTYRQILRAEAYTFARFVRGEAEWEPFRIPS